MSSPASAPRIVFMGSPDFAVPVLEALVAHFPVVGVVTQPDRPAGRGNRLTPPPVKVRAQELGLPVFQPPRVSRPEGVEQLKAWNPDLIVVAAYGQILKPNVLEVPRYGCLNVHASLLPRWRGAAPVAYAIWEGDEETGVTIMLMDEGLDTGPILTQRREPIRPHDTAGALSARLARLGAELLVETIPGYLKGDIRPQPQDDRLATYAPLLKREDGRLDFTQPADRLARQVRAFDPWPGTFTFWKGRRLKVLRAHALNVPSPGPGVPVVMGEYPAVGTGQGVLVFTQVQLEGKRPVDGAAFLRGAGREWTSHPVGVPPDAETTSAKKA